MRIAIAEAKAHFAELVRRAEAGEEIELTRHGRSVARLVAAERSPARPLIGAMTGAFTLPDDVFAGDDEIAEMFAASAAERGEGDRGTGR